MNSSIFAMRIGEIILCVEKMT